MGCAVDIYIPADWATSVPEVLVAAGFTVSTRERAGNVGVTLVEHVCVRDGQSVSFTEAPETGDATHRYVLGIAGRDGTPVLMAGFEALLQHGALDTNGHKQRRRGDGG